MSAASPTMLRSQLVIFRLDRSRYALPPEDAAYHITAALPRPCPACLIAEEVKEVAEISAGEILNTSDMIPGLEYITGMARLENGFVLIHDLETFLSQKEVPDFDRALMRRRNGGI